MRHQVAGYKLGRTTSARIALRRTLIKQLFEHERITTTHAKAKAIRGEAERLITIARRSSDASECRQSSCPSSGCVPTWEQPTGCQSCLTILPHGLPIVPEVIPEC